MFALEVSLTWYQARGSVRQALQPHWVLSDITSEDRWLMFERYLRVYLIFHGCQFWMTEHLSVGLICRLFLIFGLLFSGCFGLFQKGSVFSSCFRTLRRNKELCYCRNTQLQPLEQDSSFDWIFCSEGVFFQKIWRNLFSSFLTSIPFSKGI